MTQMTYPFNIAKNSTETVTKDASTITETTTKEASTNTETEITCKNCANSTFNYVLQQQFFDNSWLRMAFGLTDYEDLETDKDYSYYQAYLKKSCRTV